MQTDRHYDFSNNALCLSYSNDKFSLLKYAHQAFWVDQQNDSIRLLFELEKNETITSMSYDNNDIIWTGTDKGLGFFDLKSRKYHRIHTKLFNNISFLIADRKEDVYGSVLKINYILILSKKINLLSGIVLMVSHLTKFYSHTKNNLIRITSI